MLDFPRWKISFIALVLFMGALFVLPNFFSAKQVENWPSWLPSRQLALGLDLQGGSYLQLEADTKELTQTTLEKLEDAVNLGLHDIKTKSGQDVDVSTFTVDGNTLSFLVRNPADVDAVVQMVTKQRIPVGSGLGQYNFDARVVDSTRIQLTLTDAGLLDRKQKAMEQVVQVVRKRVDGLGTKEASVTRQGDDRVIVQVPGLQDPSRLKALIGKTAKLEFKLLAENVTTEMIAKGRSLPGTELLPVAKQPGNIMAVRRRADVSGENLTDARAAQSQQGAGGWEVAFELDSIGARRFGDVTQHNVGKPFAIILDHEIISSPVINSPILGGSGVITGSYTAQEASDFAALLRAGALPAKLTVIEERTVGPDLGADSIKAGKLASIIGIIAVIMFMLVTYGRFGVYSTIALICNVMLIFACMTASGATMTLPGIAGLVLTIGAAVDANVLIFERIREELRAGRSSIQAVDTGYREATRTILDANVTNIIAAIIMLTFGTGPIKGFAVLLTFGIITSVFTAVTFSRMLIVFYLRRNRPKALVI